MKKLLVLLAFIGVLIAPQAFASFDKNLAYGSKGASVKELQEFLTDHGVYSGPVTGNFYSLTLKAVKTFQTRESIKPSGYWNVATRARANDILTTDLADSDNEQATDPLPTQPVAVVPVDWCPNLQGQQDYVPFGFKRDDLGNCIVAPVVVTVTNPAPVVGSEPATPPTPTPVVPTKLDPVQPANFFTKLGNGIGSEIGGDNGAIFVVLDSLKDGVTATLTLNGKTYQMTTRTYTWIDQRWSGQVQGTATEKGFRLDDIPRNLDNPVKYTYTINLSYNDSVNGLITGSTIGSFAY